MALTTPWLVWLIIGVILLILEMLLPGFVLFFFGLGALVTFLCSWLFTLSLNEQLAIFLVSSLLSLFTLRGFIKRIFLGSSTESTGDNAVATGGEPVLVTKTIVPPMEGKVKYSGTSWRAVADERIEEGKPAIVVSQDGLVMRVKKMSEG